MKPLAALVLILGCASARTHTVAMPDPIQRVGGLYQPWTPRHEREARAVLACVGLDTLGPRPTLWVAPSPLVQGDAMVMAFYNPDARAIVFAPIAMHPLAYWPVFRHEILHHATRRGNDAPQFQHAGRCDFWPASAPSTK